MYPDLPYPGYTWSLSQHAIGIDAPTVYDLLTFASPFEGQDSGYSSSITELMVRANLLTENRRNGNPDAWRDYQQILPELGLIYSTRMSPRLQLTDIGRLYLSGEIGFSELVGMQVLRYQYPNGYKSAIQSRQRGELERAGIDDVSTMVQLQAEHGVLVKPAILILRLLLELFSQHRTPALSIQECMAYVLPCPRNTDWPLAFQRICSDRDRGAPTPQRNGHCKRNLQDWFKLLGKTDLFRTDGISNIGLSQYSLENASTLKELCDSEGQANSFWIPNSFDLEQRLTWFTWFGSIPQNVQSILRTEDDIDTDYVEENYVNGGPDDWDETKGSGQQEVALQDLDLDYLLRNSEFEFAGDIQELLQSIRAGAEKRHAKALLHDQMIASLAQMFIDQGAQVKADPNSIDLYANWGDGTSAIFEVKTVTRKSLQNRLRSGLGQIEEYFYRHSLSSDERPDKVLVLNSYLNDSAWQKDFLVDHMSVGLICLTEKLVGYAPSTSNSYRYWSGPGI